MEWTDRQACVQTIERYRSLLGDMARDLGYVVETLTPTGSAAASDLSQIVVDREDFADAIAAYCACSCPTQIVGKPEAHTGRCLAMRSQIYAYGGTIVADGQSKLAKLTLADIQRKLHINTAQAMRVQAALYPGEQCGRRPTKGDE